MRDIVGVFNAKGTPVPIPNTVVKLCSADNTWLETAREDRSTLTFFHLFLFSVFQRICLLSSVGSERVLAPPGAEEASRSSAQRSERTSELRRAKLFQGTASVLGTNDYSNVLFCPEFQGVVGSSPKIFGGLFKPFFLGDMIQIVALPAFFVFRFFVLSYRK